MNSRAARADAGASAARVLRGLAARLRSLPGVEAAWRHQRAVSRAARRRFSAFAREGRSAQPRDRWTALTWTLRFSGDVFPRRWARVCVEPASSPIGHGPRRPSWPVVDRVSRSATAGRGSDRPAFQGQDMRRAGDECHRHRRRPGLRRQVAIARPRRTCSSGSRKPSLAADVVVRTAGSAGDDRRPSNRGREEEPTAITSSMARSRAGCAISSPSAVPDWLLAASPPSRSRSQAPASSGSSATRGAAHTGARHPDGAGRARVDGARMCFEKAPPSGRGSPGGPRAVVVADAGSGRRCSTVCSRRRRHVRGSGGRACGDRIAAMACRVARSACRPLIACGRIRSGRSGRAGGSESASRTQSRRFRRARLRKTRD